MFISFGLSTGAIIEMATYHTNQEHRNLNIMLCSSNVHSITLPESSEDWWFFFSFYKV